MNYNRQIYLCYTTKYYSCFFLLWRRNIRFSPVFGSNRLRFRTYKLPASENNLLRYTEDDGTARYFLAKLARYGYFVLLEFHKFKTLSSRVSAFSILCSKNSLYFCFNFFINKILLLFLLCSCI